MFIKISTNRTPEFYILWMPFRVPNFDPAIKMDSKHVNLI